MVDHKASIIKQLTILLNDKKAKKETFRIRAYGNALQAIKEYEGEITSIEDLDKVSGLAKGSIRKRIEDFINTGEISQVKNITNRVSVIEQLSNIYGVGPSKANDLINKHWVS